ncbi:MAG: hypothetical protein ACI4QW_06110, partial [Clostridia bacterium]
AGSANFMAFVIPYRVSNDTLEVTINPALTATGAAETRVYQGSKALESGIYVLNTKTGAVRKGTRADIKPMASYGAENASRMLITGTYYGLSMIVLYE